MRTDGMKDRKSGQPPQRETDTSSPPKEDWLFRPFKVSFRDFAGTEALEQARDQNPDTCLLVMCLNGELHISVTGSGQDGNFCVQAGDCALQYHPGHITCTRCARESRAQLLEMACPAEEMRKLLADTPFGRDLDEAVRLGRPLHLHRSMSPDILKALVSLREATSSTGSAPLVLAKAMEMLWHFTRPGARNPQAQLPEETLRAVDKVRAALEANLEDPPDLESLAATAGMSLSKLKQVFPMVCGMPPFAYLRMLRMERAMHLLRDEGRSVTEAALEIGYSNLSHFSKTFCEHFGIKPSQVKRRA